MAKFQINILGCGSALPTTLHSPSAQVVDFRERLLMIDCGEGAQVALHRMRLKESRISDIFISHLHGDHCFGLPGLLSSMSLRDKGGRITIHLPAEGAETLRSFVMHFCRESSFEIDWDLLPPEGGLVIDSDSLSVEAFPLYHRVPCLGYILREKPKARHLKADMVEYHQVPVAMRHAIKMGADFVKPDGTVVPNSWLTTDADPTVSYAYCSDTMFDERVAEAVRGVHTMYHEATYHSDMAAEAMKRGHSTAAQAARIARLAGVQQLIIGHYSQRYTDVKVLIDDALTEFDVVVAANEGMKINLL